MGLAHVRVSDGFHNVVRSDGVDYPETRLFNGASNDFPRAETLIIESTYSRRTDFQMDQDDSERKLIELINDTHEKSRTMVIPAIAVGCSRELLRVLEKTMREG
ncbi:hypothetical protein [Halalkalicoccus sp. NIPERK01]|uniref:hypothetical protein n=1 Tax=Halalkalicoccus sp. NIPERK01 TaxID=3053469 RepID=UPI00256EDB5A|nr:hypothetical protein [Halalkalicoccus sp. NIPERK01]MDL5363818.1 hypothetical protein [Halalkalicoccus sp. NIPERK01]